MTSPVAVLFSGGLDSAILVGHLLARRVQVHPLYVDSRLYWQQQELHAAREFLGAMRDPRLAPLVELALPLEDLYGDHWSITGRAVPAADAPDEQVYLPGRNPLLLIKAYVWCRLHGVPRLALGSLRNNPFDDATDEFFSGFARAMDRAMAGHVELVRPLADYDKRQVMELGGHFPLELTFSCLAPPGAVHCGACNKCAERRRAFRDAGREDPTPYAVGAQSAGSLASR